MRSNRWTRRAKRSSNFNPVTFRYKQELDAEGIAQFGLVAEQVAKVDPDLVARGEQGKPYTVRYEAVNAMLLNEFLKEHRKVEEQANALREQATRIGSQERKAQTLEATVAKLQSALKEQVAAIAAFGHGFKILHAGIGFVGRHFANGKRLSCLAHERSELRGIAGIFVQNPNGRDHVRFDPGANVDLDPIPARFFDAVLFVDPLDMARDREASRIDSELGFDGLIMTDDLDMGAILTGYRLEDTIRLAIAAGNDLAMICHRIPEIDNVHRILAMLPQDQIDRAMKNVAHFKETLTPPDEFSEAAFGKIDNEIWALRVAVLGEERARQTAPQNVQRSPVEMF